MIIFVSSLLGDAEIIKEVWQKSTERSDSDTDEENETFKSISPTVAIFADYSKKALDISNCLC